MQLSVVEGSDSVDRSNHPSQEPNEQPQGERRGLSAGTRELITGPEEFSRKWAKSTGYPIGGSRAVVLQATRKRQCVVIRDSQVEYFEKDKARLSTRSAPEPLIVLPMRDVVSVNIEVMKWGECKLSIGTTTEGVSIKGLLHHCEWIRDEVLPNLIAAAKREPTGHTGDRGDKVRADAGLPSDEELAAQVENRQDPQPVDHRPENLLGGLLAIVILFGPAVACTAWLALGWPVRQIALALLSTFASRVIVACFRVGFVDLRALVAAVIAASLLLWGAGVLAYASPANLHSFPPRVDWSAGIWILIGVGLLLVLRRFATKPDAKHI